MRPRNGSKTLLAESYVINGERWQIREYVTPPSWMQECYLVWFNGRAASKNRFETPGGARGELLRILEQRTSND